MALSSSLSQYLWKGLSICIVGAGHLSYLSSASNLSASNASIVLATNDYILPASAVNASRGTPAGCKVFPGDKLWPSPQVWSDLNNTVGGNLIATIPLGSPCHDPTFNNATCVYLRSQWTMPEIQ